MTTAFKIPETITEQELIKILNMTTKNNHKLAYMLGFYECMRISEIVKLKPENIDYNLKLIKIKSGKGNKDRNIPIAPQVIKGLKYLPVNVGVRALEMSFKKKCQEVLNRDLYFHILRHSGVTHYIVVKGLSSLEAQRLAGHSKITTTQIYTHVNPQDLVNKLWD